MARDLRELSELPEEPTELLTGHRFKIQEDQEWKVVDTDCGTDLPLTSNEGLDAKLRGLAKDLATIANHRVRRYDALLNSYESWAKVLEFIGDALPGALTSGVLQGLYDLDGYLNDLVVRRESGLTISRDEIFCGDYRWIEAYEIIRARGEVARKKTKKAVRTYQDRREARITLALHALRISHSEMEADKIMEKLMKAAKIRNCDDQIETPISVNTVRAWLRSVTEKRRALGRKYCYENLRGLLEQKLLTCKGQPEQGILFAKEQLEWVRCRQPINRPIPDDEKETSKKVERTGPRSVARGK